MTQVNSPFLLPKIRPKGGTVADLQNYLSELERILQQLYRRTGAEADDTSSVPNLPPGALSSLSKVSSTNYIETALDHSTAGNEIVVAQGDITISLNTNPQDKERVRVYLDGDYTVTVDGDSLNINDESTAILHISRTLIDLVYYGINGKWVIE